MEGVGKAGTRRAVPALVVGAAALSMPGTGYRAQRLHAKREGGAGGGFNDRGRRFAHPCCAHWQPARGVPGAVAAWLLLACFCSAGYLFLFCLLCAADRIAETGQQPALAVVCSALGGGSFTISRMALCASLSCALVAEAGVPEAVAVCRLACFYSAGCLLSSRWLCAAGRTQTKFA